MGDNVKKKGNNRLLLKISVILMVFISMFVVGFAYTVIIDYTNTNDSSHVDASIATQNENYQIEVTELMEDLIDYTKRVYNPILLSKVTNSNRESLLNISIEFRNNVDNFNPVPSTERDEKFKYVVYDLKSQSDDLVYYAIKYINDGDTSYKSLFLETYNDLNITLKSIAKLESELY